MEIARTITEMKKWRRQASGSIGLVPTMGFLHQGHLSLVRRARAENDRVVVSIFVNPTQFGPREDYATYPRNTERDLALLEKEETDVVLMPAPEEVYPPGYNTWIEVQGVSERLEGASRPGHFRGVATVVAKLFNMVEPTRSYFGQKDAQQSVVIRKMVADLNMNLEVIVLPTVREADGLAMSSRNVNLNAEERRASAALFRALSAAREAYDKGERSAAALRGLMSSLLQGEPLLKPDYISISDAQTFQELPQLDRPAFALLAVRAGRVRLIDNIPLG